MGRGLLILLALLVVTWFEFQVYPGHSYLQGETQLLVPMLERLDTPGFLSRDLVASHPIFAYTIYDEITQLLHKAAHFSFQAALLWQQMLFRLLAVLGVFLWARALKVAPAASVILSGAVNAITQLDAPAAFVTNPEATPVAFASALVFFAAGLLMNRHSLLASLVGGVALLYNPVTGAAFWLVVIVASFADPSLRRHLRPAWPVLMIFALILGNLVQLQAGLGSGQELTGKLSAAMVNLTQVRTPWVWVSNWASTEIWSYLFLFTAGAWALACIWKSAGRLVVWVAIGLALSGLISVLAAAILLANRSPFATEMPPSSNLSFTVAMAVLLCGAAAWNAAQRGRWLNSLAWAAIVVAAAFNAQVLDLLHLKLSLVARNRSAADVRELAAWADQQTWGSSLFQFPDMGKETIPGVFRALSRRALWADWESGAISDYSSEAGQEWWSRWQNTMALPYSAGRLQAMLANPIDYYVLQKPNALIGVRSVYSNAEFVVYDAQDLRETRQKFTSVSPRAAEYLP